MKVLICDDDASTRFAVTRLLTRHLECSVIECCNGADAIARLDTEVVNLVMLDIEMPEMSGVDVLTAIRQSPTLRQLPVVMMSRERREEVVRTLVRLGIDGYVLKPLRADRVLAAIDPLRSRIARPLSPGTATSCGVPDVDAPAMIVDGDTEYRRLFAEHARSLGSVVEADSGSAALALFKREPAAIVFLGEQLGFLSREQLAPKLRALAASRPIRLIALSSSAPDTRVPADGCDETMARSRDVAALRGKLRRFTRLPVPPGSHSVLIGELEDGLVESGQQICTMMLDVAADLTTRAMGSESGLCVTATATMTGPITLALSTAVPVPSATLIASRMFGKGPDDTTSEDRDTAVSELCQLFALRLRDWLEARALACDCGVPVVSHGPTAWSRETSGPAAVRVAFDVPGRGITLLLGLDAVG